MNIFNNLLCHRSSLIWTAGIVLILISDFCHAADKPWPKSGDLIGTATVTAHNANGGGFSEWIYNSTYPAGKPLPPYSQYPGKWSVTVEGKDYFYTFKTNNPIDLSGAKPWPRIIDIVLEASVTLRGDDFQYSYTLHNSTKNTLPLSRLEIDLRLDPSGHPFARSDITVKHTFNDHIALIGLAPKIKPIRMDSPPGWIADVDYWSAGGLTVALMIKPGAAASGFGLIAREPVGIREYVADAYSADFFINPESYAFEGNGDEMTAAVNKGIVHAGKTVAPVAPPEPFTASTWTAHIKSLAEEARRLGWIKSDEVLRRTKDLIGRLDTDDRKQLKKAAKEIESYVLAEKRVRKITEEADALIRLNALYLVNRLD